MAGREYAIVGDQDEALSRRLKALACTAPLHGLDARKGRLELADADVYQMAEIALQAIDQVTIAMDFDRGADHDQVVVRLLPFVAAQAPERGRAEHEKIARWVLDNLINVGTTDRGFRSIYGVLGSDGVYQRRSFDFKLLIELMSADGDVYLRASDEAINVLVGALDTDVESAQIAAEVKLENLIKRGRLSDARLAAEQARYRTVQYAETLRRKLDAMMVRLVDPQPGDSVYDPCAGSGGMLLLAKEHVEEHGGDVEQLALYGQEKSGTSWAMAKMNLLLHGARDADLRNGDTLEEPLHRDGDKLRRFRKVLSNPPFSQNYRIEDVKFADRMMFGWAPETGKKADLMFVQHMVAVLTQNGIAATVMPQGVLFRGGAERTIREKMLRSDVIEVIIGLGPNLFYGTGIPACVLVLRSPGGKTDPRRQKKVLFINADREYTSGRAQNELGPEHTEKIVSTFRGCRSGIQRW